MTIKLCSKCEIPKSLIEFHKNIRSKDGYNSRCKQCRSITNSIYYINNSDKIKKHIKQYTLENLNYINQRINNWHTNVKQTVFDHYGGCKCVNCYITELSFLSIDHINGGGKQHVKEISGGGQKTYRWLQKNNYPLGYQVLCHNCNFKKSVKHGTTRAAKSNRKLKDLIFTHYGKLCICCKESDLDVLCIDHTNGGGEKHRKKLSLQGGTKFYRWLRDSNFPLEFRTLCHNCNQGIKICKGICPHNIRG